MNKEEIKLHIEKRRLERDKLLSSWGYFEDLNIEIRFSKSCFNELQARVSSRLAFLDKSIQDHKRCLIGGE